MWNDFKTWVLATLALFLFAFGYRKGKEAEQNKQTKGTLDAVQKAKKARDSLADPAVVNSLHDKYKR